MTVAVLHGAVSDGSRTDEQDVLVEVETVCRALAALGYRPVPVPLSLDLEAALDALRRLRPRFAFNLVESVAGKGSLIALGPLVLDVLGIPFTGASADATYLTSNKLLAKRLMLLEGIDTPPWFPMESGLPGPVEPGRYIVKSVWEHASIGIDEGSVLYADGDAGLREALLLRRDATGGACFAEVYVEDANSISPCWRTERDPGSFPRRRSSSTPFPPASCAWWITGPSGTPIPSSIRRPRGVSAFRAKTRTSCPPWRERPFGAGRFSGFADTGGWISGWTGMADPGCWR